MSPALLNLAPYLTGIAGLGIGLFLFLEMKRMQEEFQVRWNKRQQSLQSELGKMRSMIEELTQRLEDAEKRAEAAVSAPAHLKGINLNRRTQAMRMFRRGESAAQVAANLGVPQSHTELLLKVHRILSANTSSSGNRYFE